MHKQHFLLFFVLCTFVFILPIDSSISSQLNRELVPKLLNHSAKEIDFFLYFQSSYFWRIDNQYANKIAKLGFGVQGEYKRLKFNQEIFYNLYSDTLYLKTQEVFIDYKPWYIGQKKHMWSWADEVWANNLWQAQFAQNPVQTNLMGLVGLHWAKSFKKLTYYVFVSPFFIPKYSSYRSIKNRKVNSFTPWLGALPTNFNQLPIQYNLEKFPLPNLLEKSSLALQIEYNITPTVFLRSAIAHKPSNAIFLSVKPVLGVENLKVNINPYTVKEFVFTVESGINKTSWQLLLSSSYRAYHKSQLKELYFADYLPSTFVYNLYYSKRVKPGYSLFSSYQGVLGYESKSYSTYIELQESLFSYSYNYLNALQLGIKAKNPLHLIGTIYQLTSIYDFKQKAALLVSSFIWKPSADFEFLFNLTAFYKSKTLPYNSNFFLHRFTSNNFVQAGVKYFF